jgi:ubiquinone/menaquinone biosynthesis C-methylase UbiE
MNEFYDWQIPGMWTDIYDEIFIPAMIVEWSLRLAEMVDLRAGERVLDVACGTGDWTRCAAARVGTQGQVVGLDISPEMLAVARRRHRVDPEAAAIEWREGSAGALPLSDAAFDVVCCQLGLMFFPDRIAALAEMRRVLVPGGRLALMVWGRMERCPGQTAVAAAWARHFGREAAAGFYRQHALSDPTEVQGLIAAAGFQEVEVHRAMGVMRFPTAAHLVRGYAAMSGLQAAPAVAQALMDDVTEALAGYVGPDGLVYPIEAVLAMARN